MKIINYDINYNYHPSLEIEANFYYKSSMKKRLKLFSFPIFNIAISLRLILRFEINNNNNKKNNQIFRFKFQFINS